MPKVRDLAKLHLQAMRAPEAGGQRFLGVGNSLWMEDMAKLLRGYFGQQALEVPTRRLPTSSFAWRPCHYEARFMAPMLGKRTHLDVKPRPAADAGSLPLRSGQSLPP